MPRDFVMINFPHQLLPQTNITISASQVEKSVKDRDHPKFGNISHMLKES